LTEREFDWNLFLDGECFLQSLPVQKKQNGWGGREKESKRVFDGWREKKNKKMDKNKNLNTKSFIEHFGMGKILWVLGFVIGLLLIPAFANASLSSITLTSPTTGDYLTGNDCLNATVVGLNSTINVTFFYRTSSSSAWTVYAVNDTKETFDGKYGKCFATSGLPEGDSYQWNATAYNLTNAFSVSTATTGVTIDNTNPVAELTLTSPNVKYLSSAGMQVDCSTSHDTLDKDLTYDIVVTKPDTTTVTGTTSQLDLQDGNLDMLGIYTAVCTVTDNALLTGSATTTFNVKSDKGITIIDSSVSGQKGRANVGLWIVMSAMVLVLLLIVGVGMMSKKK